MLSSDGHPQARHAVRREQLSVGAENEKVKNLVNFNSTLSTDWGTKRILKTQEINFKSGQAKDARGGMPSHCVGIRVFGENTFTRTIEKGGGKPSRDSSVEEKNLR